MQIQSETTAIVYSVKRSDFEGRKFCSVVLGSAPMGDAAENVKGGDVMKASCEPAVFDKFPQIDPLKPRIFKMITTVKPAAQGKTQVHILDFVEEIAPPKPKAQAPAKPATV